MKSSAPPALGHFPRLNPVSTYVTFLGFGILMLSEGSKLRQASGLEIGSNTMNCDLCKREKNTTNLLCACCAEMIQRLMTIDARMNTREVCEAERLAMSVRLDRAVAEAGASAQF
jgi:hypothetical protein